MRQLDARFVDLATGRIVLPPSKAKGKKHHRVIYLTDRAREIVSRLVREWPTGALLRNSEGNPRTKDAINCAFCRLQLALGRRAMRELGIEAEVPGRFKAGGAAPDSLERVRAKHRAAVAKSLSQ